MKPAPIGGLRAPAPIRLVDSDAERVRQDHHQAIVELQQLPAAALRPISDVALPDAVAVTVPHGLGRAPLWVGVSAVRGPVTSGRIEEVRGGANDRSRAVVLKASGFGATITVDLAVL